MKEPNVRKITRKMGIPREHKFMGFVLFNPENDDFLAMGTGEAEMYFSFIWVKSPVHARKFNSYAAACRLVERLELGARVIIMMAFDLGSHIGVTELPSFCRTH